MPERSRRARALETVIESAVGSPAVATMHKSAYISYAELKYPIPCAPRYDSIGILNARPIIFTAIVDKDSRSTPDIKLRASFLSDFAFLMLNAKIPARSVFRSLLLTPMMVPVASIVLVWQVIFSYNGVLNGWLMEWFGMDRTDWFKDNSGQLILIFLFLWKNLGLNIILFLSALNNIPQDVIESSIMDGAGAIRRFFSIRLFYLGPTVFFVAIMSLINSFKIFREEYLLTGDYPYEKLYTLQHFMNNKFTHLDYSQLSTGAVIMCLVMILIVGILFFAESKLDSGTEE